MTLLRYLLSAFLLACLSVGASAQTLTNVPTMPKTPEHWMAQVLNANGTSTQTVLDCTVSTYGCNNAGAVIKAIWAVSTDSVANTLEISLNNGTETSLATAVSIPAFSGNGVGAPVNLLTVSNIPTFVDSDGNPALFLTASQKLLINMGATVSSTKQINLFIEGPVY